MAVPSQTAIRNDVDALLNACSEGISYIATRLTIEVNNNSIPITYFKITIEKVLLHV